jgi:hypothetical protein
MLDRFKLRFKNQSRVQNCLAFLLQSINYECKCIYKIDFKYLTFIQFSFMGRGRYNIHQNGTQHNMLNCNTQRKDTQHYDTQHNGTQHNGLNCDTQHKQHSA